MSIKSYFLPLLLLFAFGCDRLGFNDKKDDQNIELAVLALLASQPTKQDMVNTYASIALANYEDSVAAANSLKTAIETFVGPSGSDITNPSQANMDAAKKAWLDARPTYLQTEVFRFAKGPIDEKLDSRKPDAGIETLINAWPLDELFVDCVITNTTNSNLTEAYLLTANTATDIASCTSFTSADKNITVGWHAIEYLLWGQDSSTSTAGNRTLADFSGGTGTAAEKRRTFMRITAKLLVDHLTLVKNKWDPTKTGNTATAFKSDISGSLTNIFTGLAAFTKSEWGSQRLNMITSDDQEDEHSCFSDNTKADFYYDAQGFINIYSGSYKKSDGTTLTGAGLKILAGSLDGTMTTNMNTTRDSFCLNVSGSSMSVDSTNCSENTIKGKYDQLISSGTASSQMTILRSVQKAIITLATNVQTMAKNNSISFTAPTSIR